MAIDRHYPGGETIVDLEGKVISLRHIAANTTPALCMVACCSSEPFSLSFLDKK